MNPSKVFTNFCFICYMFIGNVKGQQGIVVSPVPSITANTPSSIETGINIASKPIIFTTIFLQEEAPSTVTPTITIKPSLSTDETHLGKVNSATTGFTTKAEISSATAKPSSLLNVEATTIQNGSINNYRKSIQPRNASDDKLIPPPAANINLTIASEVSSTTPNGRTVAPIQLIPKEYAYRNADYTNIPPIETTAATMVFTASRLANVERSPEAAVPSTVSSIADERSAVFPNEVPFRAAAQFRVAETEATTIVETATTVASQFPLSLTAEVTTIRNDTIENYEKDVESRNALDNKTMPISTTTAIPTIATEANSAPFWNMSSSPHLVPRDDAYENDYYTGISPMETTSASKPTTLFSAAVIAAAETRPDEAIPSIVLSVIDTKASVYPDENNFRREVTTNSEIRTVAPLAKATLANVSINNHEINVLPRAESIGDKVTEASATATKIIVEATTGVSDGKITMLSQSMPKDGTFENSRGHYNVSAST